MINAFTPLQQAVLAGLFGLLIGSFLNVCIHRWPRDLSVVVPRSRCPFCEEWIAWYDNIPVLSWFLLRAKCRSCGAAISARYPFVEALVGASFFWICRDGISPASVKTCLFVAMLVGLLFSDIETLLLPDQLTLGGLVIGFVFAAFVPVGDTLFALLAGLLGATPGPTVAALGESALGGLLPAGVFWFLGWAFEKLRHKEGLGFGDVKMIAMIGAFLGLRGALLSIVLASVSGSVIGLGWIVVTRKDASTYQLPFGAFLGVGAMVTAIAGQDWYWRFFL